MTAEKNSDKDYKYCPNCEMVGCICSAEKKIDELRNISKWVHKDCIPLSKHNEEIKAERFIRLQRETWYTKTIKTIRSQLLIEEQINADHEAKLLSLKAKYKVGCGDDCGHLSLGKIQRCPSCQAKLSVIEEIK